MLKGTSECVTDLDINRQGHKPSHIQDIYSWFTNFTEWFSANMLWTYYGLLWKFGYIQNYFDQCRKPCEAMTSSYLPKTIPYKKWTTEGSISPYTHLVNTMHVSFDQHCMLCTFNGSVSSKLIMVLTLHMVQTMLDMIIICMTEFKPLPFFIFIKLTNSKYLHLNVQNCTLCLVLINIFVDKICIKSLPSSLCGYGHVDQVVLVLCRSVCLTL